MSALRFRNVKDVHLLCDKPPYRHGVAGVMICKNDEMIVFSIISLEVNFTVFLYRKTLYSQFSGFEH